ncbi:MAG: hypothetical protein RMM29_00510 [Planctomycetota bacterium]|nr:hypothetical protein [Planctomycetota bacterium]MDW8372117.1 hypothetical protein [Planctomycetota bacterium]
MLRVRIRTAVQDYLADSGNAGGVVKYSDAISRQLAAETIVGSYQRDEFVNEKTGELFVWAVIDRAVAEGLARQVAEAIRATPSGDHALDAHARAKVESDRAFEELDRLLERASTARP